MKEIKINLTINEEEKETKTLSNYLLLDDSNKKELKEEWQTIKEI